MSTALVALGSNLGDRRGWLDRAVELIVAIPQSKLINQSDWLHSQPIGGPAEQPEFLNGAVVLETSLGPEVLLDHLQAIESQLGRTRHERWSPRSIDLDLLLFDDLILDTPRLVLPHPRMSFRRFVLEPAAQVAAEMQHPTSGWTLGQLWNHLHTALPYVALAGADRETKTNLARELISRFNGRLIHDPSDADPSGRNLHSELEFLRRRSELLSKTRWVDPQRLAVSDFWFDELVPLAKAWLTEDELTTFKQAWQAAHSSVMPPKLVILFETADDSNERTSAVKELAMSPGHGPVLRLDASDPQQTVVEATTAIQAMQA